MRARLILAVLVAIVILFTANAVRLMSQTASVHGYNVVWPASITSGITGYNVWIGTPSGTTCNNTTMVGTTNASTLQFLVPAAKFTAGQATCFTIQAFNATSQSAGSPADIETVPAVWPPVNPAAPASCKGTPQ